MTASASISRSRLSTRIAERSMGRIRRVRAAMDGLSGSLAAEADGACMEGMAARRSGARGMVSSFRYRPCGS